MEQEIGSWEQEERPWECQAEADPGGITIAVTESCRSRGQSASVIRERGLKER